MKTYKKITEIENPLLEIRRDESDLNPREEGDNLGYWIQISSRYNSPDDNDTLETIVKETGEYAKNVEEHMEKISERIKDEINETVIFISPVTTYEHSSVSYSLGSKFGFDFSNNGFYIVTKESANRLGIKEKDFEKVIIAEIDIYNHYVNGEVYFFTLYDENGEIAESCGGFTDIEDIKEMLPKEWKHEDLNDYFIE